MNTKEAFRVKDHPQAIVSQFLHRIWENPFDSAQRREFREFAKVSMEEAFDLHIIYRDYSFALPAGSFVWIPTEQSDKDYIVYYKRPPNPAAAEFIQKQLYEMELYSGNNQSYLHIVDTDSVFDNDIASGAAALLLTPDRYVIGSLALAQETRLQVARDLSDRPATEWKLVQENYERFYRGWKDLAGITPDANKRADRFNDAVRTYALPPRHTERWQHAVSNRYETLPLPPREVYLAAVLANNGALPLPSNLRGTS